MTAESKDKPAEQESVPVKSIDIDLKDPWVAAFLAWLVPGLGHFYQGRRGKAALFFVCVMGMFVYGMVLGEGKVVYAYASQSDEDDRRLPYLCQVGTGIVALPALVQTLRVRSHKEPLFNGFMAPPKVDNQGHPVGLDDWQKKLHRYFEFGTVFTMVAGLLNLLVIFDAWGGPAYSMATGPRTRREEIRKRVAATANASATPAAQEHPENSGKANNTTSASDPSK